MLSAAWTAASRFARNPRRWTTVSRIENECHLETAAGTEIVEFGIEFQRDRFGIRRIRVPALPGIAPAGLARLHGMAVARRWVATGQSIFP